MLVLQIYSAFLEKESTKLYDEKQNFLGYTIYDDYYGVAVEYEGEDVVSHFANFDLVSKRKLINGQVTNLLMLLSSDKTYIKNFSHVCAEFLDLGHNNEKRNFLLNNPFGWAKKWKELVGNKLHVDAVTSTLGELIAYKYLIESGESLEWKGPEKSVFDIVGNNHYYEVKTSLLRYIKEITIHGQNQACPDKPCDLLYVRLENSEEEGISINSIVKELVCLGIDEMILEQKLNKLGLEKGIEGRTKKYKIVEMLSYDMTSDEFPKITKQSFVNNEIPNGVVEISYTISLSNLKFKQIM